MPAAMPTAMPDSTDSIEGKIPRDKLVLCFDGTGNEFAGNTSDTNVVKLYDKLDRVTEGQYHYYQTGIGTYDISSGSVNKSVFQRLRSTISQTIDQMFGTTFDAHVIAGYRFLMRYYRQHSKIYIFGFSRGAFTARFLTQMVYTVGLLSMGNEEQVPFAYQLFQSFYHAYQVCKNRKTENKLTKNTEAEEVKRGFAKLSPSLQADFDVNYVTLKELGVLNKVQAFKSTFCRVDGEIHHGTDPPTEIPINVFFLGLWDCVNSVATLEGSALIAPPVDHSAKFIRHAVSVDERRVKFKPALISTGEKQTGSTVNTDIKEVWFPGNHGDIGGGWSTAQSMPDSEKEPESLFQRLRKRLDKYLGKGGEEGANADMVDDRYQMSDIPLDWMINELDIVAKDTGCALNWSGRRDLFRHNFNWMQALKAKMHDPLRFGWGCTTGKVLLWKTLELLPFIPRMEFDLKETKWRIERVLPNWGACRDIPEGALLHHSLLFRLKSVETPPDPKYNPQNDQGSHSKSQCLLPTAFQPENIADVPKQGKPVMNNTTKPAKEREDNPFKDFAAHKIFRLKDTVIREVDETTPLIKRRTNGNV